jgi:hypothetical protein
MSKPTKKQYNARIKAMRKVVEQGDLSTDLLPALGIKLETFLRFVQRPDHDKLLAQLIARYRYELVEHDSGAELLREFQKDLRG